VNNYREAKSPTRVHAATVLVALLAVVLLAGCGGSSGGSSTLTIGNENTADNALIHSSETAQARTPTSGALSEAPKIPRGVAPTPPNHLVKVEVIKGTGAEAKTGSTVEVNYVGGIWRSGKEFDSSWKRHEPFTFTIGAGQVIKGWDEGVVGMKVGGRRLIVVPPELAYGSKGTAGIPPNSTLTFIIDLLKVS